MKYILPLALFLLFFGCKPSINKSAEFKIAREFIDVNGYESALEKLNAIIKDYPDFDSAYMERGFVYYCLENYEKGVDDCSKAIELNYSNLNAYTYRAFNYGGLGDYKSAAKDYTHIIKLGPSLDYNIALLERSFILDFWGQYEQAISDLKEILKTDSSNCEALNALGVLYYDRKKDFNSGLKFFNDAIASCPKYGESYFKRGDLLASSFNPNQDYEKAIDDFDKAISLNPNIDSYYLSRGLVYRHLNQIDKALKDLDRAIAINPENGFAYKNRGFIKEQELNDLKGAKKDFEKAKEFGVE